MSEEKAPLKFPTVQRSLNALSVVGGRVLEECNRDLQWPNCIETYKKMFKDATIAPALNYMEMSIAQAEWEVKAPEGASEETIKRAEIIQSMMNDMDSTWGDFIRKAATHNRFGFAPIEKVYKKRTRKASKFDDGFYGLKDLVLIAQDSIDSWEFDEATRRKVVGITQRVVQPTNRSGTMGKGTEEINIPRNKFMLFRADPQKDSPVGTSPLNAVYVAWRYKTELEKFESSSISQEIRGLKEIKIPARYMSEDATDEEKSTLKHFQDILALIHRGEQSGILLPSDLDDKGKPMFEFNVKSVMGQVAHNIDEIIGRYKKEIVTGILAPQLTIGQDGGGSFALADSLKDITQIVIGARLKEIRDVLNHDLIPQIYQLNGWDATEFPYFSFDDYRQISADDFSKSIQRMASVGGLVLNAPTINHIHEFYGLPPAFEDENISIDEVREYTTDNTSRSGDGMEAGKMSGTSDKVATEDTSISNLEN